MTPQGSNKFTYDLKTITKKAPPSPGVYSIFAGAECVYVGTSNDICAGLLEVYFESNPSIDEKDLTHFSFDLVAPDLREAWQSDQLRELEPVSTLGVESPNSGQRRYAR
jgi:hypothetical protein